LLLEALVSEEAAAVQAERFEQANESCVWWMNHEVLELLALLGSCIKRSLVYCVCSRSPLLWLWVLSSLRQLSSYEYFFSRCGLMAFM
jgi:hypothetical protein